MIEGHGGWDGDSKGGLDPRRSRWIERGWGRALCCLILEAACQVRGLWKGEAATVAWRCGKRVPCPLAPNVRRSPLTSGWSC